MAGSLAMIDVDGTLMHRGEWNAGAHELVTHLAGNGFRIALCSGRPTGGLITLARQMPSVSMIASSSGTTALARPSDDDDAPWQLLGHRTLDPDVVEEAVALADSAGIETWAYNDHQWLVRQITARVHEEETFIGDTPHVDPILGRRDIGKVLFLTDGIDNSSILDQVDEWDGVNLVMSGQAYADLIPAVAAHTKGGDLLIEHLGIGWDDVLAIGDGQNDLGMLTRAGQAIGVAPFDPQLLAGPAGRKRRGHAENTAGALDLVRSWV